MNTRSADKIRHALNTDVIKRMLCKYFIGRGFTESFDSIMYPGLLQDLPMQIPILATKVEIIPHCVEIDPIGQKAVLGWNLFVLGTHRMFLGETHHRDLGDLARQIQSGMISPSQSNMVLHTEDIPSGAARRQVTPREVIVFITRVLGRHESGYVDLVPSGQFSASSMAFGSSRLGALSGGITGMGTIGL